MVESVAVFQAFAAGVLGFFAPCSVAMLPAYISYYLRGPLGQDAQVSARPRWVAAALVALALGSFAAAMWQYDQVGRGFARLSALPVALMLGGLASAVAAAWWLQPRGARHAAWLGGLAALGILAVFALLGLPFAVLFRVLSFAQLAYLVLATGASLVVLGVLGLLGRGLSVAIPVRAPRSEGPLAFLLFGVAYGLVSLGCNLPLFVLGAVGPLLRAGDPATAVLGAAGYGAGMASVMLIATLSLSVSRGLTRERIRAFTPLLARVANVVLVLAGLYIMFYFWSVLRLTA